MAKYVLHSTLTPGVFYGAIVVYDDGEVEGFGEYERVIENEDGELTPAGEAIASGRAPIRAYLHVGTYSTEELIKGEGSDDEVDFIEDLVYVNPHLEK